MMRPDTFTHTEADAAAYERDRAADAGEDFRDRPDATDLAETISLAGTPVPCTAVVHNPTPAGTANASGCLHCPSCGGVMRHFTFEPGYYWCSARCGFTFGTASEPPF